MSHESNYSFVDRAIHRLAFASPGIQATASDVEALLYGKRFRHLQVERPIFVTSLPRAGTTLVLEILSEVAGIATHRYRDMPFVLAPVLWDAISSGFRRPHDLRERAHGDGMAVGYDSPEAFEEVLWRGFWPEKYTSESIALWSEDEGGHDEFRGMFLEHIRKILALRAGEAARARYASKNNANVARIRVLKKLFPDCIIVVPVRDPIGQAASLLHQHRRFRTLHARDAFAKTYMGDIGHLEFGELHRPIAFDGMLDVRRRHHPDTLDYWVGYWDCALRHVLKNKHELVLVSYEALCTSEPHVLPSLAEQLAIPLEALTAAAAGRLHAPRDRDPKVRIEDADLERRALATYEELLRSSVSAG